MIFQEERQTRLREQARRILADSRSKSHNLDSPSSPLRSITQRIILSPERTISPINNLDGFLNRNGGSKENSPVRTPNLLGDRITPPRDFSGSLRSTTDQENNRNSPSRGKMGSSPLQSFNSVMDKISPKNEKKVRLIFLFDNYSTEA